MLILRTLQGTSVLAVDVTKWRLLNPLLETKNSS